MDKGGFRSTGGHVDHHVWYAHRDSLQEDIAPFGLPHTHSAAAARQTDERLLNTFFGRCRNCGLEPALSTNVGMDKGGIRSKGGHVDHHVWYAHRDSLQEDIAPFGRPHTHSAAAVRQTDERLLNTIFGRCRNCGLEPALSTNVGMDKGGIRSTGGHVDHHVWYVHRDSLQEDIAPLGLPHTHSAAAVRQTDERLLNTFFGHCRNCGLEPTLCTNVGMDKGAIRSTGGHVDHHVWYAHRDSLQEDIAPLGLPHTHSAAAARQTDERLLNTFFGRCRSVSEECNATCVPSRANSKCTVNAELLYVVKGIFNCIHMPSQHVLDKTVGPAM
ncbi:hypothetical protein MRX96_020282 [Rhipicephalus microplus]